MNSLVTNKDPKDVRIVVAMSGGVDSSVVACMLKDQGYDVVGITLQLYDVGEQLKKSNACCAGVDIMDAKRVAHKHNFEHYVLNYQNLFKQSVIDDFVESYIRGETPIPCVRCNQSVKFRDLMKVAKDLGADALATGHYVIRDDSDENNAKLLKAKDSNKDQSYFLFATTQEQLNFLRFPLGDFKKEQTRELAEKYGLAIANKPDSQDICFVPNGDYSSVIKTMKPSAFKVGNFIHVETKKILGQHNGIINFTLGQRRGLGISYPEPLYVVKIDPKENIVYVGEEDFLQNIKFFVKDLNWLVDENYFSEKKSHSNVPDCFEIKVRLRSNHEEEDALVKIINKNEIEVVMKSYTRAITPGQACVMYDGSRVIGGGFITKNII